MATRVYDAIARDGVYGLSKSTCARLAAYLAKVKDPVGRVNAIPSVYVRIEMIANLYGDEEARAHVIARVAAFLASTSPVICTSRASSWAAAALLAVRVSGGG